MMKKKEFYTNITPLPSYIPRQLTLDLLHSHSEIITLNPLVLEHNPISAPRDAPAEEYYATWYEITERIQVVPGAGRLGSNKIKFRGCFHDVPWGVQTHIYAPLGIDLRHNYRVAGSQPGEPQEFRELGINAPVTGLYLREDIEIRCNFTMVPFVKSQLKSASKILVDRLLKKAELLDAGILQAMMENGKLKTINPADQSKQLPRSYTSTSPTLPSPDSLPPSSPRQRYQMVVSRPSTSASNYELDDESQQPAGMYAGHHQHHLSHPGLVKSIPPRELPGDINYYQHQALTPPLSPPHPLRISSSPRENTFRDSVYSTASHPSMSEYSNISSSSSVTSNSNSATAATTNNNNPNTNSNNNALRPPSTTSTIAPFVLADGGNNNSNHPSGHAGGGGGKSFVAELPAMQEMHEEKNMG